MTSGTVGTPPVSINSPATCTALLGASGCPNGASLDNTALRGSFYAGWNYQVSPSFLWGAEGDVGLASRSRSLTGSTYPGMVATVPGSGFLGGTAGDAFTAKTTWDASARLRAGWLANPSVLLYVTGGVAFLHLENTSTCTTGGSAPFPFETCTQPGGDFAPGPAVITHSTTRVGGTVGAGLEARLVGNWIARGEYRYANYGTVHYTDTRGGDFPDLNPLVVNYSTRVQTHTATFGISYLWGGTGPY